MRSLDPHAIDSAPPSALLHQQQKARSEERLLTGSNDSGGGYRNSDVGHGTRESLKEDKREKKGGFWSREKGDKERDQKDHKGHERDKDREREREKDKEREKQVLMQYEKDREKGKRDDEPGEELTRMIGERVYFPWHIH